MKQQLTDFAAICNSAQFVLNDYILKQITVFIQRILLNNNENSLSGKPFSHGKVLYKLIRSLYFGEVVGAIPVEDKIPVIDKMNILVLVSFLLTTTPLFVMKYLYSQEAERVAFLDTPFMY